MAKTIAVTGAGGFIGARLCQRALEAGYEVRGLDLRAEALTDLRDAGARAFVLDVNDDEAMREAVAGVDWVIHAAAIVGEDGDRDHYMKVNVEGTRSALAAARAVGVARFLHISSVMVYGFDYPEGVDEDFDYERDDNIYNLTKQLSDEDARAAHDPDVFETLVIRPGDVYGPGSTSWVERPLEMLKSGWFNLPEGGRGVINHVHVDNLIDAIFLAIEKDVTGEAINVTDGVATSALDFFRYHAQMVGKRQAPVLPTGLLKASLFVSTPFFRLAGKEPPANPEALRFLMRMSKVSTEKARRLLGYEPRISLDEGMEEIARAAQG